MKMLLLSPFLTLHAIHDGQTKTLNRKVLLVQAGVSLMFIRHREAWELLLLLLPGMSLFFLTFTTGGAVGEGDGLLLLVSALFFTPVIFYESIILSFLLAGIYGLIEKENEIPYAPFLAVAVVLCEVFSEIIGIL